MPEPLGGSLTFAPPDPFSLFTFSSYVPSPSLFTFFFTFPSLPLSLISLSSVVSLSLSEEVSLLLFCDLFISQIEVEILALAVSITSDTLVVA